MAIHRMQPWWRGTWARTVTVVEIRRERRCESLHRKVLARMRSGGLVYALNTWRENVIDLKLNRDRMFLLRQIADRKWIRHCALRIQHAWRSFYYMQLGTTNNHLIHSTEFSLAQVQIKRLRSQLHPRIQELVTRLEEDGDADQFAIDLLGDVEMWQNPEEVLLHAAAIELDYIVPLEPLPLHQMRSWIEHTLRRTLLWRDQPLDCVNGACRCNPYAREAIHGAGYCRGRIGLPHVVWFPFLHVVQKYFVAVERMREAQRNVVQALQEKRMMETLGRLLLADTADRGSHNGTASHPRFSKMGLVTRSKMNNLALGRDEEQHDYLRWFTAGVDTCVVCHALLSWLAVGGACQVCGVKRLEAPTSSSTLQSRNPLPPLGSRRGETSRRGLTGVGDVKEGVAELLRHAAMCVYAPAGHWRRLMPKWKVWEECRRALADPSQSVLSSYNIHTIGSLWLAKISGQLHSIPELEPEMTEKLSRLMDFLGGCIVGELLAPESN